MQMFHPYQVQHFDLATIDHDFYFSTESRGLYGVVWYKTIPLSEFYLSAEKRSLTGFYDTTQFELKKTLKQYVLKSDLKVDVDLITDLIAIRKLAQEIFDYLNISVPEKVPVSLVICTRNRAESLGRCLSSLKDLSCQPSEIIVVDNASTDGNTKTVVNRFEGVKYVFEPRPGLDIARNTGALSAKENIIVYTDDDTEIHTHWLYHVYESFQDEAVHAMTGLVLTAALDTEAQWIFERHWSFNRGFVDKLFDQHFFMSTLYNGPPVWDVGAGANMAFRKQTLIEAGYFDERLDVGAAGCSGDSEIWYRILANGHTIHYNPRAVVTHYHRSELQDLKRQIFFYMRGFATAILIQYHDFRHSGNLRHLFKKLPPYYLELTVKGFPYYRDRYATVGAEIKGILSGLIYYMRKRKRKRNNLSVL